MKAPNGEKPAHGGHQLPADGTELVHRLSDDEATLAAQGVCGVGDLLQHLGKAGEKAGNGSDLTRWNAEAIAWAALEVRAFENTHPPKPSAKKVA